VAITKLP
jgi:hypothetical protein